MKSAAIMLVVAAVLILIGTFSKNWMSRSSGDIHIGPMGEEACMSSICVGVPTRGIPGDIEAIMVLALISGFASAAAAGTFGGRALARKTEKIPIQPRLAQATFVVAAISMTLFVIRMLSEKFEISWAGFPAIAGAILAVVGLKKLTPFLAARLALPAGQQSQPMQQQSQPMQPQQHHGSQPYPQNPQGSQPMQPHYGSQPHAQPQQGSQPYAQPQMAPPHAPPPQQQIPNCPRCGTQLHFVAQYQRWFCPREQQYV